MMMTHWSYLTIIERPTDPAPEWELRYTVRLHYPDGLSVRVENVVTGKILFPKFDVYPAFKVGEIDPETGEEMDGVHPVHWIGQKWYPWIIHTPKAKPCAESAGGSLNFPVDAMRALAREEARKILEGERG